jgi:hypothetical protein
MIGKCDGKVLRSELLHPIRLGFYEVVSSHETSRKPEHITGKLALVK